MVDKDRLAADLTEYYHAFYEELAELGVRYSAFWSDLPEFLRSPSRVDVYLCADGLFAFHMRSEELEVRFFEDPKARVADLVRQLTKGGIDLGDGPPGLMIAEPKLTVQEPDGTEKTLRPAPWKLFESGTIHEWARRGRSAGIDRARADTLPFVTAALLESDLTVAPESLPGRVLAELRVKVSAFESLLDSGASESEVQRFLEESPVLLDPSAARVLPKVRLGSDYVTDFVVDTGEGYRLVELESPQAKLFTQKGDPTMELRHGQRQVEDWMQWVRDHPAYAREALPDINDPAGEVFIGRSKTMKPADRKALVRHNASLTRIVVRTYDSLLGSAKQHLETLGRL